MKAGQSIVLILAVVMSLLLFGCNREAPRTDYITDADFETGNISVEYTQALVIYCAGDVVATGADGSKAVEVGDYIEKNQSLKLGEGAFCELQFGEKAVVRIEEKTEVMLQDIFLKPDATDVQLKVTVGTLLCKVEKLAGDERFRVRTRTALCGVRGTEFGVTVSAQNDTHLAVKTGKVSILPSSVDADKLKEAAPAADPAVTAAVKEIEDSAQVVSENQETIMTESMSKESEAGFKKVENEYNKLANKKNITPEENAAFRVLVRESNADVKKRTELPKFISPERKEALEKIDEMKMHKVPVVPVRKPGEKTAQPSPVKPSQELIRIGVRVEPFDADIFLGGKFLGRGKFQGLFKNGETISLNISKPGFDAKTLTIAVSPGGQKFFEIKLDETGKPKAPDEKKDAKSDGASGKTEGKNTQGKETGADQPEKGRPIVQIAKLGDGAIVGDLLVVGTYLYGIDEAGTLYACDGTGHVLWRNSTKNRSKGLTSPVFGEQRIFFSGSSELIVCNAWNGQIQIRLPLEDIASGASGRRVALAGKYCALPTDKSIRILDLASGKVVRETKIPGDSHMSPTFFGGKLFIANLLGAVEVIDPETGVIEPKTISTSATEPVAIDISVFNSRGYFAGWKNMLVCLDLASRQLVWEREYKGGEARAGGLAVNDVGVFVYAGGRLIGYSHDGTELWTPRDGLTAPPLALPGKLVVGRNDNSIHILDARTGNSLKTVKLKNRITTRPVVMDRFIVVGTESGEIIILDPEAM